MRLSIRPLVLLIAVALLTALSLGLPSSRLEAQDAQSPLDRGTAALSAGKYEDALQAFSAAYAAQQTPMALYGMGAAFIGLSQPSKALQAYEAYVGFADPATEAATIGTAKAEIKRINDKAARFAVKVVPQSAQIQIDGHAAVIKDNEIWILPGTHSIDVRADGYESFNQSIDVQSGRFTLDINLRTPALVPPEQAIALVDEGMMLKSQANTVAALAKLREAEKIYSTPRGLAQLGFVEEMQGDLGSAEGHLTRALAAKQDPWVRKNRASINKSLKSIKKRTRDMAKLDVSGPYPDAQLTVNEIEVSGLPRAGVIYAAMGRVVLRARLDGYQDFVLDADMPKRSLKRVQVQLEPLPPIPVPPVVVPPPPAAAPVVVAPPPPPPPPPAEEPKPEEPADGASQADIEAQALDVPPEDPIASGFEMQLNGGYLAWLSDSGLRGTSGGPALQLHLGIRPVWPLSFGLELINVSGDFGVKGTKVVGAGNPGLYVRGHTQKHKHPFSFDVWGGVGVAPVAMQFAILDSTQIDPTLIAQGSDSEDEAIDALARQMTGLSGWLSLQTINVPLELGTTFYLASGFGIDLSMAFTFWLPQQMCLHDEKDVYCTDKGLETQKTFFIGGGFSFLP